MLCPLDKKTMSLIWLKIFLGTHQYIFLTYAKNYDFMLGLELCLRLIKTPVRHVFSTFFTYFALLLENGKSDKCQTDITL